MKTMLFFTKSLRILFLMFSAVIFAQTAEYDFLNVKDSINVPVLNLDYRLKLNSPNFDASFYLATLGNVMTLGQTFGFEGGATGIGFFTHNVSEDVYRAQITNSGFTIYDDDFTPQGRMSSDGSAWFRSRVGTTGLVSSADDFNFNLAANEFTMQVNKATVAGDLEVGGALIVNDYSIGIFSEGYEYASPVDGSPMNRDTKFFGMSTGHHDIGNNLDSYIYYGGDEVQNDNGLMFLNFDTSTEEIDAAEHIVMHFDNEKRVGIGMLNPPQTLTVSGSAQITGKFHDSSGASGTEGQALLADSQGKLVWGIPSSTEIDLNDLVVANSFTVGASQDELAAEAVILDNLEAFDSSNIMLYNATQSHGSNSVLFNGSTESGGNSNHLRPIDNSLDWGIGYRFSTPYLFSELKVQNRTECCFTRAGGGVFQIYNNNNLVYTSPEINTPNLSNAYSETAIPNVIGDEVRYIFLDGANTQSGQETFNASEIVITGKEPDIGTSFFVSNDGKVGVGTSDPTNSLSVEGSAQITGKFHDSSGASGTDGLALISDVDGKLVWGEPKYVHEDINITNRLVVGTPPIVSSQENQLQISNTVVAASFAKSSKVASTTPSSDANALLDDPTKLTVHGSAKITGKFYDSSGIIGKAGQILTSDTSGKLVWNNTFNPKGSFTVENLFTNVEDRHIVSVSQNGSLNFEEFNVNRVQVYNAVVSNGGLTSIFDGHGDAQNNLLGLKPANEALTWGLGYTFLKPYFIKKLYLFNQVVTASLKNLKAGGGRFKVYNRGVLVFNSKIVDVSNLDYDNPYIVPINVIGDEVRYVFEDGAKTQNNDHHFRASEIIFSGVELESVKSKPTFIVNSDGNVGVGTTEPSSSLTVSGSAQITGILKDSSGASGTQGQSLSSDSEGKLVWLSPPSDKDHANLVVSHSLAVSTSPVIIGTLEGFVPTSIKTFNARIFYGKPEKHLDALFNGKLDNRFDSSHIRKISSHEDDLEWGLGYKFSKPYAFRELKIQTRGDSFFTRAGGGVFRIYNNGALVYTSQKIIAPNAGGQYTDPVLVNIVGDEVRYIFENGNAAQDGDYIFNASELVISGNNIDSNEGSTTSFLVSQDQIDMKVDKVVVNHGRSDSNPTSLSVNADWVVPGAVLNVAGLVYIAPKEQRSQIQAEINSILNDDYKDIFGVFSERQIIAPDYAFSNPEDWADYVFEKDYDLLSLQDEKNFINENGHLPGFPSKEEVEDQGYYSSDELNMNLLRKVEELTLHLIKQNEDLKVLKSEIETLKAELITKNNL